MMKAETGFRNVVCMRYGSDSGQGWI